MFYRAGTRQSKGRNGQSPNEFLSLLASQAASCRTSNHTRSQRANNRPNALSPKFRKGYVSGRGTHCAAGRGRRRDNRKLVSKVGSCLASIDPSAYFFSFLSPGL